MIGGLLRTTSSKDVKKLPFLSEAPVVGAAFRNNAVDENERELIIFLTPYILDDNNKKKFEADASMHLSREMGSYSGVDAVSQHLDSAEMGIR
jgi:type II secretory pathway component GspD/PulD (secretin)